MLCCFLTPKEKNKDPKKHSTKCIVKDSKNLPSICKVLQHCHGYISEHGASSIKETVSQLIDVVGKVFRVYHPRPRVTFHFVVQKSKTFFFTFRFRFVFRSKKLKYRTSHWPEAVFTTFINLFETFFTIHSRPEWPEGFWELWR